MPSQPSFGAAPTFAPRPQPSAFTSTPILTQPIEEEEPQVIKYVTSYLSLILVCWLYTYSREWREKQEADIKARDEASKAKRDETVSKAERAIDQFYEEYAAKKERNIRENKFVSLIRFL